MFPPLIYIISPLWFQFERGCWTGFPNCCYSSILVAIEGEGWESLPFHSKASLLASSEFHHVVPYGICSFMEFSLPLVTVNKLQGNELILPLIFEG